MLSVESESSVESGQWAIHSGDSLYKANMKEGMNIFLIVKGGTSFILWVGIKQQVRQAQCDSKENIYVMRWQEESNANQIHETIHTLQWKGNKQGNVMGIISTMIWDKDRIYQIERDMGMEVA
jgi:hypothetical protein